MTAPRYTVPDLEASARFIERLRALTPEQWEEFARSLDPWRGDDIRLVWRRAGRRALIGGHTFLREVFQLLATVGELVGEFWRDDMKLADMEEFRRNIATQPPQMRPFLEQSADVSEIVREALPGDRLAAETIELAVNALRWRPAWRPALFAEAYAPLGPFIPADSVSDVA